MVAQLRFIPQLSGGCQDQISAPLRRQRFLGKVIEGEPELVSVGVALDVQFVAYMFQADYVVKYSLVGFAELENGKGIHREPMISFQRQDPYRDVRQFREIRQSLKLRMHH